MPSDDPRKKVRNVLTPDDTGLSVPNPAAAGIGRALGNPSSFGIGLDALAHYLKQSPFTYEDKWFHRQEIKLSGYSFSRCRFDDCALIVSNGIFRLDHCFLAGSKILYLDDALRIVRL